MAEALETNRTPETSFPLAPLVREQNQSHRMGTCQALVLAEEEDSSSTLGSALFPSAFSRRSTTGAEVQFHQKWRGICRSFYDIFCSLWPSSSIGISSLADQEAPGTQQYQEERFLSQVLMAMALLASVHAYIHIYIYIQKHTYAYIHMYTYIHLHKHTHTHK